LNSCCHKVVEWRPGGGGAATALGAEGRMCMIASALVFKGIRRSKLSVAMTAISWGASLVCSSVSICISCTSCTQDVVHPGKGSFSYCTVWRSGLVHQLA
jgi:hypothetical protein